MEKENLYTTLKTASCPALDLESRLPGAGLYYTYGWRLELRSVVKYRLMSQLFLSISIFSGHTEENMHNYVYGLCSI